MQNNPLSRLFGAACLLLAALFATLPTTAADCKPDYGLSTGLGETFPRGWGGKRWAELVAGRLTTPC